MAEFQLTRDAPIIRNSQWQLLYMYGAQESLGITPIDSDDEQLVATFEISFSRTLQFVRDSFTLMPEETIATSSLMFRFKNYLKII